MLGLERQSLKQMIQDSFGFEKILPSERTRRVRDLFGNVSQKYDIMNDLMSLGIHRYWKKELVQQLPLNPNQRILDVAGGTGDIALKILSAYPHLNLHVSVCDLTPNMLEIGRDRGIEQNNIKNLDWICGNAENLPLSDNSYDLYIISFGLRNVTDIGLALHEAYRVLKPGGVFVCLEFSKVNLPILERLYDVYSFNVLPFLGGLIAKDRPAYQYLVESIRAFPAQEVLADMLKEVKFQEVSWQNFLSGVCCIHNATKPL